MKRDYKISDIRKALDAFEKKFPEKQTISFTELEKIIKRFRIPVIYNIEDLIRLLSSYINENYFQADQLHSESEVCKILKVKKLAMHEWRTKGYIKCVPNYTRTIRYDLTILLKDLKNIRDKNISIDHLNR